VRELNFIHAQEDVPRLLCLASEMGLTLRNDRPTCEPASNILNPASLGEPTKGVFVGYRSEWVFGEFKHDLIDGGYNRGKYFQMPATNYAGIQLYFSGERSNNDIPRLGNGFISRDIDWYNPANHTVSRAPPEVKETFDQIMEKISTRKYIIAGGCRYIVLQGALKRMATGALRPPFDFMDSEPIRG
jgi:hypothetical protein